VLDEKTAMLVIPASSEAVPPADAEPALS